MKLLGVQNELELGFLFLTCVPGGGLGHLIVAITGNTSADLSVMLQALQLLIPIGELFMSLLTLSGLRS